MLALLVSLVVAQDAAKPVTISLMACSAKKATVALAEKTGVPITVQARIADEIVEVEVRKMPLKALVERLAYVLHAQVEPSGPGYLITRPKETQIALEAAEVAARESMLKEMLDKKSKELASAASPTARAEAMVDAIRKQEDYIKDVRGRGGIPGLNLDDVRREAPAGRLNGQLAILLGAKVAAVAPNHATVWYSNHPVKGQLPLPAAAADLISEYTETEQHLATLLDDSLSNGEAARNYPELFESARMTDGVGKIRFGISRNSTIISYSIEVFTKTGKRRGSAYLSTVAMGQKLAGDYARNLQQGKPKLVALSPLRAEFEALAPYVAGGARDPRRIKPSPAKMSPELRKAIGRPEDYDPLELLGGSTMRTLAESRDVNLVACLTELLPMCEETAVKANQVDLNRFEACLQSIGGMSVEPKDGTLTVRPLLPVAAEERRLSRKALGDYVSSMFISGEESLYSVAKFNLDGGWAIYSSPIMYAYQRLLDKQGYSRSMEYGRFGHELLCFMGSLGPKLLEEKSVDIGAGSLTSVQQKWLYAWLNTNELAGKTAVGLSELNHYPVEAFKGDNPLGVVRLEFEEVPAAQIDYTHLADWVGPYTDAAALAKQFAYWTEKSKWAYSSEELDKSKFFWGTVRHHRIGFFMERELFVSQQVDVGRGSETKAVPYSQLPQQFRDQVKKLYEEARRGG